MTSFKSTLLIQTFITFLFVATRAMALPTVIETAQFTDRFRPILPNPTLPAGDYVLIAALIESTAPPVAVSAKQGEKMVPLNRYTPVPNEYHGFVDLDPNLTGAWEIVVTDSTGTGPSAFTNALAEPEFLPFAESLTPQGSPRGASLEWTLPDLTGFDVEWVDVRIVQVEPRSTVFLTSLSFPATSFEPPPGVLQYGVEYAFNVALLDTEGFYGENRSVAQSQPFRYALPGDFNLDGVVDATDLEQWQGDFGLNDDSDADADGDSDGADFLVWQRQLGTVAPSMAAEGSVPEPGTLSLIALSVFGLAIRARRRRSV